tara:strand:- start:374 stop:1837 length:1464 start_codon:yes stop_codon:yes gene_type:complete
MAKFKLNVERTLNAFTSGTYKVHEALYEFLDNSEAAGAGDVYIIAEKGSDQPLERIIIADNGKGMTREELLSAMEFAGEIRKRSIHEVSEFGVGLKAAAFSLSNSFSVITRSEDGTICGSFIDRQRINKSQQYDGPFDKGTDARAEYLWGLYSRTPSESGTIIILDDLCQTEYKNCQTFIGREDRSGIRHSSRIATRYCDKIQMGRMKIHTVCGTGGSPKVINANDPLSRLEESSDIVLNKATQLWKKADATFDFSVVRLGDSSSANDFGVYVKVNGIYVNKDRDSLFGMFKEGSSHSWHWHLRAEINFKNKEEFNKIFDFTSHKHDIKVRDPVSFGDWLRDSAMGKIFVAEQDRRKYIAREQKKVKSIKDFKLANDRFIEILNTRKDIFGASTALQSYFGKFKSIAPGNFANQSEMSVYDDGVIYYNDSNYHISSLINSDVCAKNHQARTLAAVNAVVKHTEKVTSSKISFEDNITLVANLLQEAV